MSGEKKGETHCKKERQKQVEENGRRKKEESLWRGIKAGCIAEKYEEAGGMEGVTKGKRRRWEG